MLIGARVILIGTLTGEMAKAPGRDEAKRAAMMANVREFTTRCSEAGANAEVAAPALADRCGSARGEAGFDAIPDRSRPVQDMAARGDRRGREIVDLFMPYITRPDRADISAGNDA